MSLWRDDINKQLDKRIQHLINKPGVSRWVWVVGNTDDGTESVLRGVKHVNPRLDIEVIRFDSEILADDPDSRVNRLSETVNAGLDTVRETDDYWIHHESDLRSPVDLINRLLETEQDCVAGMVWLGEKPFFYDTWAYRGLDEVMFTNHHGYHKDYKPYELFEVQSFGSVWMMPAQAIRDGLRCDKMACLDLCEGLRERGHKLYVNPAIDIVQPRDLWTSRGHAYK